MKKWTTKQPEEVRRMKSTKAMKTKEVIEMKKLVSVVVFAVAGIVLVALACATGKLPAGVHPVVDVEWECLFGGTINGKWVDADAMLPHMKGGEMYTLYTREGRVGTARGTRATYEEPNPAMSSPVLHLRLPKGLNVERCVIGISGDWNALPRAPKWQSTQQKVYQDAVRALLSQEGLTGASVNVTAVVRVDLEGDGTEEVLVSATTPRKGYPDSRIAVNDYSLVLLRKLVKGKVKTSLIVGEFYRKREKFAAPGAFTLDAMLDVNGDGVMEVILGWRYYEGIGRSIYEIRGTAARQVLGGGFGS